MLWPIKINHLSTKKRPTHYNRSKRGGCSNFLAWLGRDAGVAPECPWPPRPLPLPLPTAVRGGGATLGAENNPDPRSILFPVPNVTLPGFSLPGPIEFWENPPLYILFVFKVEFPWFCLKSPIESWVLKAPMEGKLILVWAGLGFNPNSWLRIDDPTILLVMGPRILVELVGRGGQSAKGSISSKVGPDSPEFCISKMTPGWEGKLEDVRGGHSISTEGHDKGDWWVEAVDITEGCNCGVALRVCVDERLVMYFKIETTPIHQRKK